MQNTKSIRCLYIKIIVFAVSLISVYFLSCSSVAAQQGTLELSVAPAILEIVAEPGEEELKELYITNNGDFPVPVAIEISSLETDDILNRSNLASASSWISVERSPLILDANETKKIEVLVDIPDNTFSGGYYAQINIRALALEAAQGRRETIAIPEIVVTTLVSVPGELIVDFEFMQDNIFPQFTTPDQSTRLNFSVRNTGNTHNLATPVIIVNDRQGNEVYKEQLRSQLILPNFIREFEYEWSAPEKYGVYTAQVELNSGENKSYSSSVERMFVTIPIVRFIGLCIFVYLIVQSINKRKEIKQAIFILKKGSK